MIFSLKYDTGRQIGEKRKRDKERPEKKLLYYILMYYRVRMIDDR